MNTEAVTLQLNRTHFANPTGLDLSNSESGAYGSAKDIASLMAYILKTRPEILQATTEPMIEPSSAQAVSHRAKNTNPITRDIPGLIASKTGFTDTALGNLAIAFDRGLNQPVIVVVLGSNPDDRFTDVLNLVKQTMTYFAL